MKFRKLIEKLEKLDIHRAEGRQIAPAKLEKLRQLLSEKQSRYEHKLAAASNPEKIQKWETRLKVVRAQLVKLQQLAAGS